MSQKFWSFLYLAVSVRLLLNVDGYWFQQSYSHLLCLQAKEETIFDKEDNQDTHRLSSLAKTSAFEGNLWIFKFFFRGNSNNTSLIFFKDFNEKYEKKKYFFLDWPNGLEKAICLNLSFRFRQRTKVYSGTVLIFFLLDISYWKA